MNSDLYTEEFRDFKYLKCQPIYLQFYKKAARDINAVQLSVSKNNPDFVWQTRLEFIEQLLDLRNDIVYWVEPGMLYNQKHRQTYDYEDARLHEIVNPVIYHGHPLMPEAGIIAQLDDVSKIEDKKQNADYCLCPDQVYKGCSGQVFKFDQNPLVPSNYVTYNAMFYNKEWAEKYRVAITQFLRKNNDAVSTITSLF